MSAMTDLGPPPDLAEIVARFRGYECMSFPAACDLFGRKAALRMQSHREYWLLSEHSAAWVNRSREPGEGEESDDG
jgi:hypothetical protein